MSEKGSFSLLNCLIYHLKLEFDLILKTWQERTEAKDYKKQSINLLQINLKLGD